MLITALAGGATIQTAAQQAHVSESTVYRRLEDPAFRQRVSTTRAEMMDAALGLLTRASAAAVTTLVQLLQSSVPPSTRLGAAGKILDLGAKYREDAELEQRIRALEEHQATQGMANSKAPWAA